MVDDRNQRFALAVIHALKEELRARGLGHDEAASLITFAALLVVLQPPGDRGIHVYEGGRA